MPKTINAVPESISREQYVHLIESIGFDPYEITELKFDANGIVAVVPQRDSSGTRRVLANHETFASHHIYIPILDGDGRFLPWSDDPAIDGAEGVENV